MKKPPKSLARLDPLGQPATKRVPAIKAWAIQQRRTCFEELDALNASIEEATKDEALTGQFSIPPGTLARRDLLARRLQEIDALIDEN